MTNEMIFEAGDKVAFVNANHVLVTNATVVTQFADPIDGRTRVEVTYTRNDEEYRCSPHKERVALIG